MGHGSHGSHGSHSSTSNEDVHTNSVSATTLSTSNANSHSATLGGILSNSLKASRKLYDSGSTDNTFAKYIDNIASMRQKVSDKISSEGSKFWTLSPASPDLPTKGQGIKASIATLGALAKGQASSAEKRYQPFTLTLNTTAEATSTSETVGTATPVKATKTQTLDGTVSTATKTWTNKVVGTAGTVFSYTFKDNLSGQAIKSRIPLSPNLEQRIPGKKITSAQASKILGALQASSITGWTGPASKTFSWTGSNSVAHTNHTNHSSHSSCSETVKENISNIPFEALKLINDLDLVSFNYKENIGEDPSIKHYGFIAENTPEEFSTHYKDRMDYTNCIGILLKAVQELSQKVEELSK